MKNLKKNVNKSFSKLRKKLVSLNIMMMIFSSAIIMVNAANSATTGSITDPNATFDAIITFIAGWIGKLGLVVALIGAIQFGFAVKNDDADGKTKGVRAVASGIIVFAVTKSLSMFGIA